MNNESPYNTENEGLCSRCDRQEAMKNIIFYCLVAEMHVHENNISSDSQTTPIIQALKRSTLE